MSNSSTQHSDSANHVSKPWLSYPQELPQARDAVPSFPEFSILSDPAFTRSLTSDIRHKVLAAARHAFPPPHTNAAILLQGGTSAAFELYDSDTDKCEFRQEMFFRYLFGVNEPRLLWAD